MTSTIQAGVRPARNPRQESRATRGLRLFRERREEIAEVSPGTYRIPGSGGATYTVSPERGYCSCPDRASPCKHIFAVEVVAAKRRCRRRRTADRPTRRRGEDRRDRRGPGGHRDGPARDESRESLRGVLADQDRLDLLAERMGV